MKMFKEFWEEEDGIATVEILLILAVLIVIAIIFRKAIVKWVQDTLGGIFGDANQGLEEGAKEGADYQAPGGYGGSGGGN